MEAENEKITVSKQDAAALMRILLERGYFGKSETATSTTNLIERTDESYVTVEKLLQEFQSDLTNKCDGRQSIQDAAAALFVSEDTIRTRIIPLLDDKNDNVTFIKAANGQIQEVLTATYVAGKCKDLLNVLNEKGVISLSDAAESIYDAPVDVSLMIVEDLLAKTTSIQIRLDDHGAKVLVTTDYLDELKNSVTKAFCACTEPVQVKTIVHGHGWEHTWVLDIVHDLDLPGEFHGEQYVPDIFTKQQRQAVLDSFHSDGFVTAHMCQNLFGMSSTQMKDCVVGQESSSSSFLVLENSVIHPDVIVAPIAVAVQDAVETATWLDLQLHLPLELLEHETDDARILMEEHVLASTTSDDDGVIFIKSDGALYFSQGIVDDFTKSHLSSLVENWTKTKAQELFEKEEGKTSVVVDDSAMTGKEKRKARKAKSKRHHDTETTDSTVDYGTIPLDNVVKALTDIHPDLSDLDTSSGSVLAEICRLAFCTDTMESMWNASVQKELERLRATKKTTSTKSISQRDILGDFQSVEAAFEDQGCFAHACFMIQSMSKFLLYASEGTDEDNDDIKDALQKELLLGCCVDFTSRITQFALFKNDVDNSGLSFQPKEAAKDDTPYLFYSPVDLSARSYRKTYLSAAPDQQTNKRRDPLPLLREVLPGSIGVSLARQWILCGGECYQGGVKPASENSGEPYTRPGDFDGFLAHVQENCLTICGLPFTKLDKKSEKKFLNVRRQSLMNALQVADEAEAVLDLTIMLLYQLVKNLVVTGPLLRGPILQMLIKERKVSESTSKELCALAESLTKGEKIDPAQIERVKGCGLNKQKG